MKKVQRATTRSKAALRPSQTFMRLQQLLKSGHRLSEIVAFGLRRQRFGYEIRTKGIWERKGRDAAQDWATPGDNCQEPTADAGEVECRAKAFMLSEPPADQSTRDCQNKEALVGFRGGEERCHATKPAMSAVRRALPRRRALCTNWKKPR